METINCTYLIIPAIAAIVSAVIAGVATYYSNKNLENHKAEIHNLHERQKIYSQLLGRKLYLEQIYITFYEARIRQECYSALFNLARSRNMKKQIEAHFRESFELEEEIRAHQG
jgi:hypothetical protein